MVTMSQFESARPSPSRRMLRKAVVAGTDMAESHIVEAVAAAEGFDVVFVQATSNAYSQIKRESPSLIIVYLHLDDPIGFQLLSMLNLDAATSRIPVVTYVTSGSRNTYPVVPTVVN